MGIRIRIVRHFGQIAFAVYLCLVALVPVTHCHIADVPSEHASCNHAPLPFLSWGQCCELHENGHRGNDDHHIHFLLDDSAIVNRHNQNDTSPEPLNPAAADDVSFANFQDRGVGATATQFDLYQEALRLFSSGLSPPLS